MTMSKILTKFSYKSSSKNLQLYIESSNLRIWAWNINLILDSFITPSFFIIDLPAKDFEHIILQNQEMMCIMDHGLEYGL